MVDESSMLKVLENLGTTQKEVAESLSSKGISGSRRSGVKCPVANYLKEQFPEATMVVVGDNMARLLQGHNRTCSVLMPEQVRWFVREFDKGYHPNLVGGGR